MKIFLYLFVFIFFIFCFTSCEIFRNPEPAVDDPIFNRYLYALQHCKGGIENIEKKKGKKSRDKRYLIWTRDYIFVSVKHKNKDGITAISVSPYCHSAITPEHPFLQADSIEKVIAYDFLHKMLIADGCPIIGEDGYIGKRKLRQEKIENKKNNRKF